MIQDITYGVRLLRRDPGFSALAMLTLALGIGASTTLFSVVYGVLLKPLPWPGADRLVRVSESREGRRPRVGGTITNGTYLAWQRQPSTIEAIGGWLIVPSTAVPGAGNEPVRVRFASVTPSLFAVLQTPPLRGRLLVDDDAAAGGVYSSKAVVVLSYGAWQEWFGGRDDAVGGIVRVGDRLLTVVGVMPRSFAFPDRETRAWTPFAVPPVTGEPGARRVTIFSALARLRPGATPVQASAEGTSRARGAPDPGLAAVAMFGGDGPPDISAVPAVAMMTAEVRPALLALLAAVALLLATATANVASLQLARAMGRRREIAIRVALGASATQLTRQLLVESTVLGLGGGVAGVALALALHRAFPSILPADFPRAVEVTVDGHVMLFACGVTMLSSVVCGLLPALHAARVNLLGVLSDGGNAPVGLGTRSPTSRARGVIMVGQIAVSCVLVVGAALFSRSFVALLHADRGFNPSNLLTARIPLPSGLSIDRRTGLLEAVVARLSAVPGVTAVGFGNALPLLSSGGFRAFMMPNPADRSEKIEVSAIQRVVSPGYFTALGLRMVAGRLFAATDSMTSLSVIIVNRSFAAKYLGADTTGQMVQNLGMCRGDNDRWQVVGIVGDMHQGGPGDPQEPEIFMPYAQVGCAAAVADPIIVARTTADPLRYVPTLRAAIREQAPDVALDSVMSMEERVGASLTRPRLYAGVLVGFGTFSLIIAGVGLFGVLSYNVLQRAREIAVRKALGARSGDIARLVLRQAFVIVGAGISLGLVGAFALMKWISTLLYGVNPYDPGSFVAVALVLAVVAITACLVPAWRAARVDPLGALRG